MIWGVDKLNIWVYNKGTSEIRRKWKDQMRETRIEVTAEEYERWSDMPQSEWEREFVGKYVDDSWKFGYGFYGCRISGEPNIIIAAKGDTCD